MLLKEVLNADGGRLVQLGEDELDVFDVLKLEQVDVFDQTDESLFVLHCNVYHFVNVFLESEEGRR